MTYSGSPDVEKLKKATLRRISKTVVFQVEE
jgi:hypothetical protein